MAKIVLHKVVESVTESVLRQLMPELDDRLASLKSELKLVRQELNSLDTKIENLREEMLDRFERQLATINEVSHRVTRVEGKLEGYMEALRTVIEPVRVAQKRKAV
jgi:uncharacterized coiled-coil protein SlyX